MLPQRMSCDLRKGKKPRGDGQKENHTLSRFLTGLPVFVILFIIVFASFHRRQGSAPTGTAKTFPARRSSVCAAALCLPLLALGPLLSGCANPAAKFAAHPFVSRELKPWGKPFSAIWVDGGVAKEPYAVDAIYVRPAIASLDGRHSRGEDAAAKRLCRVFDEALAVVAAGQKTNRLVAAEQASDIFLQPAIIEIRPTRA